MCQLCTQTYVTTTLVNLKDETRKVIDSRRLVRRRAVIVQTAMQHTADCEQHTAVIVQSNPGLPASTPATSSFLPFPTFYVSTNPAGHPRHQPASLTENSTVLVIILLLFKVAPLIA